ncbi:MAG: hypothetical protein ACF788_13745 [Novipirellula sp. JB048]
MTFNATGLLSTTLGLGLILSLAGCGAPSTSTSDAGGAAFLLSTEPAGALTPTEFKEAVTAADAGEPASEDMADIAAADTPAADIAAAATPVVLAGRIDAGDLDPFEKGKATFILSELPDAEHAEGDPDHANNCPFCKRKLKNAPKVVVRFVDPAGELIAQDAQAMLGVKKGDAVVVKGVARYQQPINMIQIDAEAIYRR